MELMGEADPSCTTIRQVLEELEARVVASPIAIEIGDPLSGPSTLPSQRGALSVHFRREATRNLREQTRQQDFARVEDTIVAEVQQRLSPKAQTSTRGDVYDVVDDLRDLLTTLSFRRQWNVVHVDTREQSKTGEYLTILLRFSTRRYETLGG